MPRPIPARARPAVPQVPQEVPVIREHMTHIRKAATKKNLGERNFTPRSMISGTVPAAIQVPTRPPLMSRIIMGTMAREQDWTIPA